MWSALAHQGDVYSASFAAVPYVILALARAPDKADHGYFQFPPGSRFAAQNPEDLQAAYMHALAQLPFLVAAESEIAVRAHFDDL
ncbi:hypothetical protein CEK65_13205 [Xanthomonas sp. LMG 12459]|nr:hypothetical protein CEK65_13205 [Xanthomonas sp. LMG 12459]